MIWLAGPALRQAVSGLPEGPNALPVVPLPVFLGLPENHPGGKPIEGPALLAAVAEQAGVTVDAQRSQVFPRGRAAALLALDAGIRHLIEGRATSVLVGGVDTFLDLRRLGGAGFRAADLGRP